MRKTSHRGVAQLLCVAAISACALVAHASVAVADPYTPVQNQDNAEFAIADGYIAKQMDCTPDLSPVFGTITWDPPGFTAEGGSGMIHDADPALGGQFAARWAGDYWDVEYQFC
jgi:hypothetical protein